MTKIASPPRVTTSSWTPFAFFTERARAAIVRARHTAGTDEHIGSAHLLLGLLAEQTPASKTVQPRGVPLASHILVGLTSYGQSGAAPLLLGVMCDSGGTAAALRIRGIPVTDVWAPVSEPTGPPPENHPHHRPFAPDAAQVLGDGRALAGRLGHGSADIPHILFALTRRSAAMLYQLGVDPVELRQKLTAELS